MSRTLRKLAIIAAVIIFAAASESKAGWVLSESDGEETVISKGKMRAGWDQGALIFDGNKNELHLIDDGRKMVATSTLDDFCAGMKQMMESVLQNVPPEQREMMKQMMKSKKAPEVKLVEKGAGKKVAGFKTVRYDVMADGELHEELWLATDKALMKDCEAVMKMMGRFMECVGEISAMGAQPPTPEASPEYSKIFDMGMIVKSVEKAEGKSDVTTIAKKNVPDSTFKIPKDYKVVSFFQMWGMGE